MVWGGGDNKFAYFLAKFISRKNLYLFINFGKEKRVCGERKGVWGGEIYFDVCVEEINACVRVHVCVRYPNQHFQALLSIIGNF